MPQFHWHMLANAVVFLIALLLKPEIGVVPFVLLILADAMLDTDHLIKFRSVRKIFKHYNKCVDYPFHKIWIVLPIALVSFLTPVFWFGIGLLVHFSLDFVDNHIIFNGKFKWV